jgi:RNA polymerase sigma-70 factor (ECF subfamily)
VHTHDFASAEDALSEALVAALTTWPRDGVPQNPEAWLLTAARHSLIDVIRHHQVVLESEPTLQFLRESSTESAVSTTFQDERLKLLFVCAHPAIDASMHAPLMLQTVLGLDAARIAQAFLIAPKTMGQRLFRAKTKIRSGGIQFEIPQERDLPVWPRSGRRSDLACAGASAVDAGRSRGPRLVGSHAAQRSTAPRTQGA